MQSRTKNILSAALIGVPMLLGGIWLQSKVTQPATSPAAAVEQAVQGAVEQVEQEGPMFTVSQDGRTVSYEGEAGKTALAIAKELAVVTTEDSSIGEFVTGFNGTLADASSEYWAFYVNGDLSPVGAGTYDTSTGDQIEWKLETF